MRVVIKSKEHNNCHISGDLLSDINCEVGDIVDICTFRGGKGKIILKAKGILIEKKYEPDSFTTNNLIHAEIEE